MSSSRLLLSAVVSPKAKENKLWEVLMDGGLQWAVSTTSGFRITCFRPCRISVVPKLQTWDLSLHQVCLLVYQVCMLSETLYSVQKLRVITGMPWTASLPRTLPQDGGPAVHICGVCVCPPVNVLKFLFYKVVCLK